MARKAPAPPPFDLAARAAAAEKAVRDGGAVTRAKLGLAKLRPEERATLERELARRGLELTPKLARVPLSEQLEALLAEGSRVALKELPRRLRGATAKEAVAAADRLARSGKAVVVVRTVVETLVAPREAVVGAEELAKAQRAADTLTAALRKVKAKGRKRTLLVEDLAALLAPLQAAVAGSAARGVAPTAPSLDPELERALDELADPALGLVFVPALVRSLAATMTAAEVHAGLRRGVERGALELRPESGVARLSPDDAALCVPGALGALLSYARRVRG